MLSLIRLLKDESPDIVQTWMYHADLLGGVAARLVSTAPVFWGIRRTNVTIHRFLSPLWMLLRINSVLSWVMPRVIVCCAAAAKESHRSAGFSPSKFRVIPNGFDLSNLRPDKSLRASFRAEFALDENTVVLGSVGRWVPEKDYGNVLEALSLLCIEEKNGDAQVAISSPWLYIMVGSGLHDSNEQLAAEIRRYGLHGKVLMIGPRSDIRAVMSALDLHILSSMGEGFPNVVGEAMACGTPCVVTDVGDAAHIVGDTGWVVPSGCSGKLAKAIKESIAAMADDGWDERKTHCRQRIQDLFSIERMVASYCELWRLERKQY
jgi:glycosyltransferase involved in cell wall biosynthesis